MALISLQEVSLGFGGPLLLEEINLQIEQGERVGLLGLNGSGKSTLLKLAYGEINPENGIVTRQQNLRMAYMPQEVPRDLRGSVLDIIASGLESSHQDSETLWQQQIQVDQVISRMQLDPQASYATLSAGMKRRVLLGRGFVRQPDLLLLDEPTNHLDIDAIRWLEDSLLRWGVRCCLSRMTGLSCSGCPLALSSLIGDDCSIGTAITLPSCSAKMPC
jgi:ABC transport system ATP-binding/permease protein